MAAAAVALEGDVIPGLSGPAQAPNQLA
ncbi:hypothetical protein BN381_100071 [Candidatus Microthrix parvicella RN1]|uniref:Uncharacterized protein n=1 Tax=Candidatus Neomicrothrix parvicella RN1 TaxID=1229780 RepID=R4YVV7_9ACTN|nr:hypothetical protein BN381_100071 [Candidatus Microthrix parvicella RN1]